MQIRGLNPLLIVKMREIVKKYHNGKAKGKEGSYVAADLNHLIRLYIMTEGTICHSEAVPSKRNVVKNALKKLAEIQEQTGLDGFEEVAVKKAVTEECVRTDRIDPRTIQNYTDITMQLLDPLPEDMLLYRIDPGVHNFDFI